MPDLLGLYNEQIEKQEKETSTIPSQPEIPSSHEEALEQYQTEQNPSGDGLSLQGGVTGDDQVNQANANTAYSNQRLGAVSTVNTQNRYDDPTSWTPEYSDKNFIDEVGNSIMWAVGNDVIKGTGDMLQVLGGLAHPSLIRGNMISDWLQYAGEDVSAKFKSYIPEELQGENITWATMMNPKFWSVNMAKLIPNMAEFILLSHGGSTALRKGVGALAKGAVKKGVLKGASKTALGRVIPNTGKGLIGKLASNEGLTATGEKIIGAVGGGITGNIFSGVLNSAELVNSNKDLKDDNGNLVFDDEDLRNMAVGTIKSNAKWVAIDIASWGMTFGGGWKGLKGLNPVSKGAKIFTKAEQSSMIGKAFAYEMAPIIKGLGRVAGKMGAEGFEEMYQESWEEWSKKKAYSKVTGEEMEYNDDFFEFFKSKENEATRVMSFAMGALSGGVFNIKSIINQKADDSYRLYDRAKNLSEITNKNGTDKELEWQEYHINKTISDIVIDGQEDAYNEFMDGLIENENITEEERSGYDQRLEDFKAVNEQAKNLNVKGREALLYNNHLKTYAQNQLERYEQINKDNIQAHNDNDAMSQQDKDKAIREEENDFKTKLDALALIMAEAAQNEANLILGKKATPLTVNVITNKYGKDMVVGGLSGQDFLKYTGEEGVNSIPLKKAQLKQTGKNIYDNIVGAFQTGVEFAKEKITDFKESTTGKKAQEVYDKANQEFEDAKSSDKGKDVISKLEELKDKALSKLEEIKDKFTKEETESKPDQETTEEEATEQAKAKQESAKENIETPTGGDVISNEEYKTFKEKGQVPGTTLTKIANRIHNEESISPRQEEMRQAYEDEIGKRIVKKILGVESKPEQQPSSVDQISKNDLSVIEKKHKVKVVRTDEGFDIETELKGKKKASLKDEVIASIEKRIEEKNQILKDEDLSEQENEFLKDEADTKSDGKTIAEQTAEDDKKAIKGIKVNPKNIVDAADKIGMDSRKKNVSVRDMNMADAFLAKVTLNKIRNKNTLTPENELSQNEIDNYLNRFTTYNLLGPGAVHQMTVVNHQLKNMFPNTNNPPQVIITRNLFESVGSKGLGMALAGTIYIDEKAWEQDDTFMHEMSHIYYQLSKDEPHTQKMIKQIILDKELIKAIKAKYDDYTLYKVHTPGGSYEATKKEIFSFFNSKGGDLNSMEDNLKKAIEEGDIETIPLRKQRLILEEAFVAKLEGPLSNKFDKVFNTKNEVQREKDTRIWWGLIRKKGKIIEQNDGVDRMLKELFEAKDIPQGDLEGFIFDTFKAVTKGVTFDSYGLENRENIDQEYLDKIEDIQGRMDGEYTVSSENVFTPKEIQDELDQMTDDQEEGVTFDQTFSSRAKKATRMIRRFGMVYNKALRAKKLINSQDQSIDRRIIQLFNRDLFESTLYNLATENSSAAAFVYNIENSQLEEVKSFNRFLNKVFPNTKLQMLKSMHYVMSNSKHIVAYRNTINDKNEHDFIDSMSLRDRNFVDNTISRMKHDWDSRTTDDNWNNYQDAVLRIYNSKKGEIISDIDLQKVLMFLAPSNFNYKKIREQGDITYRGVRIPIDTLIVGVIKSQMLHNRNQQGKVIPTQIFYSNARPLITALVNTNRKFTPLSTVKNAEGNMEPVKITNNHLTKEIDNMINYLAPDENAEKKTLEQFLDRFAHLSHPQKEALGKSYVPNGFLENIYNQYQSGILPTVIQYHGIEDSSNKQGTVYKDSTSLEQSIEDFVTFVRTSTSLSKGRNNTYLANMGAFSDSPRKFFINMNRVNYEDVFTLRTNKDGKKVIGFNPDGKVLNSIFAIHNQMYKDDLTNNKAKFRKSFREAISNSVDFVNSNSEQISKLKIKLGKDNFQNMSEFFTNESLNLKGQKMVAEYTINSIVNGYNMTEVFAPGIKGENVVKRFKLNSSPVMSVKNSNFKIEPLFFADEILNNSISGTDSAMYILKEDAELWQRLGKGVFNMNSGFKFLNASIEKNNPNFKGKTAYLKGYTTIIDETHPLHKLMKARKDKYIAYHKERFGVDPSKDLSDGSYNHIVLAIAQSSDKSNFSPIRFTTDKDENGNTIPLKYINNGENYTEAYLAENIDEAMKHQDDMYYDKKGEFIGIESYNFGPQQIMDKVVKHSNTPVQMINSIIVNATLNGKLKEAYEIQRLISEQKALELDKVLSQLKATDEKSLAQAYKELINNGLNKEEMDQAQKMMFEEKYSSIAHPYLVEIITNQLAKTLRKSGNKLETEGTLAHQKPDTGWRSQAKGNKALKGYSKNTDGSINAAEIALPQHMSDNVEARTVFTSSTSFGKQSINKALAGLSKTQRKTYTEINEVSILSGDLMLMELSALELAAKRHGVSQADAYKYIGKEKNKDGIVIGYHVKGQTVIATRVPGHGPSSTGVFEVVGFNKGEGNQTSVSSEFNDIIGSDNDGDSLFIQMKSKNMPKWNKAFDLMTKYWLSPDMAEQIQTTMDFKDDTEKTIKNISEVFPQTNEYLMPFSPQAKSRDYNNTMVSKRSVGPVFNIHKMTNLLASTNTPIVRPIKINSTQFEGFSDTQRGQQSRNQQSAILANIILDNSKHGYADALGLNEHNISQAVLMVNLGMSLEQVGLVLNSPAAKLWSDLNRNNNSMFHDSISKPVLFKQISNILYEANRMHKYAKKGELQDYIEKAKKKVISPLYKSPYRKKKVLVNISLNKIKDYSQQDRILETLNYLADMNSEIQKLSTIMGGHKKIHVNPLVLEKQIAEFKSVLAGKSKNKTIEINDKFKQNPDMQNYLDVAEATLEKLQEINPIYREATNSVITNLSKKIGEDLSVRELEQMSKDILLFNTARLLGLNNVSREYIDKLLDSKDSNIESIYNKLNRHFAPLKNKVFIDPANDVRKNFTLFDTSILFKQAMNMNLHGNKKYISGNPDFKNASFNEVEWERARDEFEQLPTELRDDLILYDLIHNGWKGPASLSPFFSKQTNMIINMASNEAMSNKNLSISPKITERLEKVIALKRSKSKNNPFKKVYLPKGMDIKNAPAVRKMIFKDKGLMVSISKGQPMYINIIDKEGNRELYELEEFTNDEMGRVASKNSFDLKTKRTIEIANDKINLIPYNLHSNTNVDVAIIADKNNLSPYKTYDTIQDNKSLDFLVEASITYEESMKKLREGVSGDNIAMEAKENYYDETFTRENPLTEVEYENAMEFQPYVTLNSKSQMYEDYKIAKAKANEIVKKGIVNNLEDKSSEQLIEMYNKYGENDVYAFASVVVPITKQLAKILISEQEAILKKNNLKGKEPGKDVSVMQAFMMSGSTIPSNHPASQALARTLEKEYKNFINEKKKYTSEMDKITDALYNEKLGYGGKSSFTFQGAKNFALRIKDALFSNRIDVYNKLYGNMVIRQEGLNDKGKLVINYKLRPENEFNEDFKKGYVTKAEKDFYDFFRKTTKELMPKNVKEVKEDYIPHTSMTRLEAFSNRGLLGLLAHSRTEDHALQDVKMRFEGEIMSWKTIEDKYKYLASKSPKLDARTALEFRKLKSKAKKLLASGKNEDGSRILTSAPFVETAMGFGAINRFANNRSVKSTELPSMDLNKALGDYIHASLFVNGNENFKGMHKLQGYIDGVLAWNSENNLPNMNKHIQTVWKDYFLRQKRQTSFMGPTTDRVILGLTRLNLFYALGYSANVNTGGMYAIGNVLAGKYHNIKDIGAGAWAKGEMRFWGLDKGFKGGLSEVNRRRKRMARIMKNMNFMDINVYDEVSMEQSGGLDRVFTDLALSPMILSEKWIQQVHMLGLLTDQQLDKFDQDGNYKQDAFHIDNDDLIRLEDQIKSSHGRGYQPTDQRAIQMYSWGNMMLQFSRFIPTMVHDRFAKEDVNIYGRETIGTMTAVGKMLRYVVNNPREFVQYRKNLSEDQRRRLDSGLKGMAMSTILSFASANSDTASKLFWDVNYYWNYPKLAHKAVPAPMHSISNLVNGLF